MKSSLLLFGVFIVATFIAASAATIVIFSAKQTQNAVLGDVDGQNAEEELITKTLFTLNDPYYSEQTCEFTRKNASVAITFQYGLVPQTCSIFVNDKLHDHLSRLQPDCVGSCPQGYFDRQFSLGELDSRDTHTVRVCCNQRCLRKTFTSTC